MNQPNVYTHLETLLLVEFICETGIDPKAWETVSERLNNHYYVKTAETYRPERLKVGPLQDAFWRILGNEFWGDEHGDAPLSPGGAKKRKADGSISRIATAKDLWDNIDKMPAVQTRLYARYKAHIVQGIRKDESDWDKIQMDIRVLEKNEMAREKRLADQNGQPPLAPKETKPGANTTATSPSPGQTMATPAGIKRGPTTNTPVVPPKPPNSSIAAPSHLPPSGAGRPPQPVQASNTPSPVLQAPQGPQGTNQLPSRGLQAPPSASKVPISPRPEAAKPTGPAPQTPAATAAAAATAAGAQGTLKWEKPYQPPAAQGPPRQTQSPVPTKAATPQQYAQNQQQWQQQQQAQQNQYYQQGQATAQQQAPPTQAAQGKPVLAAPQTSNVQQIQPGPPRPTGTAPPQQQWLQSKTPIPPPHRPIQPQQPHSAQQPRPIASASPTPQTGGLAAPPQRWPQGSGTPGQAQRPSQSVSPAPQAGQKDKPYASPYAPQPPRPAIPEHMIRAAAAGTPTMRRATNAAVTPVTPIQLSSPQSFTRGFGTKWAPQSTPSTPRPLVDEPQSPAYEPVSPPKRPAVLPQSATMPVPSGGLKQSDLKLPQTRKKREQMKKLRDASGTPSDEKRRRSESIASGADELALDHPDTVAKIKDEDATPRPNEEGGDTTADESVPSRSIATPGSVSRLLKRKRQDTPPEPPGPPVQVLWTRGFTKVSSSALDQISSHRDGNMFATRVREKDAPNYSQIVLQPTDITAIRSAIKSGNKAASQAANALPGGDPSTTTLWLPISEDLTPPKGIINSAQLERELVHMFCNAIMYNPDPDRGLGQSFMKRSQEEEEEAFGYRMDEFGVVRNTQSMFVEVEKLLGDLRSAEKDRTGHPPPSNSTPRHASVATPADDTAEEEDELAGDGGGGDVIASGSNAAKRRRTTMRG